MNIWTKNKKQPVDEKALYGYELSAPSGDFKTGRASICLVKALLMFSASLGTVGSIVTAFDMSVNFPVIILFLLAASLILSFLHYHHVLFNIGYPVVFVIFAVSIFQNRLYANSGYQAIINLIREEYRFHFGLNYGGEAFEAVDDRYTTMTYALIYLGFFLVVLLNIAISTHMSIFFTMLFTFPFLQFGLYIGNMPSLFFIILLLFSYAAVAFLKKSGHYTLSENRKKDAPFRRKKEVFSYKGHGRTMGQLAGLAFLLLLVFSLVTYPLMGLALPGADQTSSLKAATDTTIQTLVQSGFASLFNRYEASGGISEGKLGGVSRVSADYETDMEITFVPTGMDTVYLKAYTGGDYTSEQWLAPRYSEDDLSEVLTDGSYEEFADFTAHLEANRLALFAEEDQDHGQRGKMVIKNIDADDSHLFLPYYTADDSDFSYTAKRSLLYGSSPVGQSYTLYYYPYTQDFSSLLAQEDVLYESDAISAEEKQYIEEYEKYCKDYYSDIPAEVMPALEEAMEEIGEGANEFETVEKIQNYFFENFQYSVSPGTTPRGKDFVTYFLQVQKKGYCSHFATAGTLLCRAYGIPARYVEGYVVQITDIADAELVEGENVEDWLQGSSDLAETGVVTVSIPDANAHAWTEIYMEGFGWIPVDFTTAASGDDATAEYDSFLSLFAGLFSIQQNADMGESAAPQGDTPAVFADNLFFWLPVGVLTVLLVLTPFVWKLIHILRKRHERTAAYRDGRFDEVLPYYFRKILRAIQRREPQKSIPALPREVFALLTELLPDRSGDTEKASVIFEKGLYGKGQLKKEEADFFIQYAKEILSALKKS